MDKVDVVVFLQAYKRLHVCQQRAGILLGQVDDEAARRGLENIWDDCGAALDMIVGHLEKAHIEPEIEGVRQC